MPPTERICERQFCPQCGAVMTSAICSRCGAEIVPAKAESGKIKETA